MSYTFRTEIKFKSICIHIKPSGEINWVCLSNTTITENCILVLSITLTRFSQKPKPNKQTRKPAESCAVSGMWLRGREYPLRLQQNIQTPHRNVHAQITQKAIHFKCIFQRLADSR